MGTHQELTTEQIEFLILIKEIEQYREKAEEEIIPTNKEIITQDNYMTVDEAESFANRLQYYGYLDKYYELTVDGEQYIDLFKDYLKQKALNPVIEHASFSLINIEELEFSLDACLGRISILENVGSISELLNKAGQAIKKWLPNQKHSNK